MWEIRALKIVILYSSILFLIFGFSTFNESFAQEQEFDENISVTLDSDTSTEPESEHETEQQPEYESETEIEQGPQDPQGDTEATGPQG